MLKQTICNLSVSENTYELSPYGESRKIKANFFDMRPDGRNYKANELDKYYHNRYDIKVMLMAKRFIEAESFYVTVYDTQIGCIPLSTTSIPTYKEEIDKFVESNLDDIRRIIYMLGTQHIGHIFKLKYEPRYAMKEYLVLRSNAGSEYYTDYYNTPIFKYAYEYIKPYNDKMLIPLKYIYVYEEIETIDINFLSKMVTLQDIATCKKYHNKRELDFLSRILYYSDDLQCDTYKKREPLTWCI